MNKALLQWIHFTILDRISSSSHKPLRNSEEKLDFILFILCELCVALGTNGTQNSIDRFMEDPVHDK